MSDLFGEPTKYTHALTGEIKSRDEIEEGLREFTRSFTVRCYRGIVSKWIAITLDNKTYKVISIGRYNMEIEKENVKHTVLAVCGVPRLNKVEYARRKKAYPSYQF